MIESLVALDRKLFLFLNGMHMHDMNRLMYQISGIALWIPFYLLVLFLLYRKFGKNFYWILLAFVLCFAFTDQIALIIKNAVMRLRPSRDPSLEGLVHTVNGYVGGKYGFISSHASNTMGFAVLVSLLFQKKWMTFLLIVWSVLVSYSRIYLGVHYPLDILGGWTLGILSAFALHALLKKLVFEKQSAFQKR